MRLLLELPVMQLSYHAADILSSPWRALPKNRSHGNSQIDYGSPFILEC